MTFAYHAPHDLDEALATLADLGERAQVLAGGTDVVVQYLRREIAPEHVVYLGGLDELRGRTAAAELVLGALTTHRELADDPLVRMEYAGLAEAAGQIGGWQTQNAGTVGGNLCNASPAADLPPSLLLADARVTLRSASGERDVPLAEFFIGRRRTARRPDELVTAVTLSRPPAASGEAYLKLGRRRAMEIAIVGLAVRLAFADDGEVGDDGEVADARIAVCAASERPYRADDAERALVGSRLEDDAVAEAGRLVAAAASPIDDVRASADYRRRVLEGMVARAAQRCRERALAAPA
ncbi:MAG: FAD binding domain-containing protein [Gaiellaceae bacterium]